MESQWKTILIVLLTMVGIATGGCDTTNRQVPVGGKEGQIVTNKGGPDIVKLGPQPLKAVANLVGRRIPDVSFTDLDGSPGKLSDYAGYQALVIAMNVVDCPICRKFATAFKDIEASFEPRRVAFLMVNGNDQATSTYLKQMVGQLGFRARYLPDVDHSLASLLSAKTSSEVFILDQARTLVYRGPISDQYGLGYSLSKPRNEYLKDALESTLRGEIVKAPALTSPGCALEIPASQTPEPPVTFNNRISRIIQYNCQSCHRPGEAAPFALGTHADVKGHAAMIRYVVQKKIMPPWFASNSHGTWSNDATLASDDRKAVLEWLSGSMPEGDIIDAPLPIRWPQGSQLGTADLSFSVPKPIAVPADGVVPYLYVIVNTDLKQDAWINGMEILSPRPGLIHHVSVFVRRPEDIASSPQDGNGPNDTVLAIRAPGVNVYTTPPEMGYRIPQGSQLVFQIHVTPNGIAGDIRPTLNVKLSKTSNLTEIRPYIVLNTKFLIPPGAPNYPIQGTQILLKKTRLLTFIPHMHLRGKAFRVGLHFPDGTNRIVLEVPKWDFNWQLRYSLAAPIDVPAGTEIRVTGWYDNSADNPANPDPSASVQWGEQTTDEMLVCYIEGYPLE